MDVQRQIKENSEELQSMVKDLYAWEDEIKKKDQELKQLPKPKKTLPPIRGTTTTNESTTSPAPKTDVESNKKLSIEAKEKGNAEFQKKNYKEAIEHYTKSIELDPMNAISYTNRAMAYLQLNKYEEAEADCTSAIAIDKTLVKAFYRRAVARKRLGKTQLAISDFQEVLSLEPANKSAKDELQKLRSSATSTTLETSQKKPSVQEAPSKPQQTASKAPTTSSTTKTTEKILEPIKTVSLKDSTDSKPSTESKQSVGASLDTSKSIESKVQSKEAEATKTTVKSTTDSTVKVSEGASSTSSTAPKVSITPSAATTAVKKPSKVIGRTFVVKHEVPKEPPKSAYEFEYTWNSLKNDMNLFSQYMKLIPPENLPGIFKSSLSSEILSSIIVALQQFVTTEPSFVFDVLKNLTKINRFEMNLMFLSQTDKSSLATLFSKLSEQETLSKEEIQTLQAQYKLV